MGVERADVIEHLWLPEDRAESAELNVSDSECHSEMFVSSGSDDDDDDDEVSASSGSSTSTSTSYVDSDDITLLHYLRKTWIIAGAIDDYMHHVFQRQIEIINFNPLEPFDDVPTTSQTSHYSNVNSVDVNRYDPDFNSPEVSFRIPESDSVSSVRLTRLMMKKSSVNVVDRLVGVRSYTGVYGLKRSCLVRCVCDSIQLYCDYRRSHYYNCIECQSKVCNFNRSLGCRVGISTLERLYSVLCLRDVQYCDRHHRFVRLNSYDVLAMTELFRGVPCEMTTAGDCFHCVLYMLYKKRKENNSVYYCSDVHKSFATWLRYQECRPDSSMRTVIILSGVNIVGIFRGYSD